MQMILRHYVLAGTPWTPKLEEWRSFVATNALSLNASKCEVVVVSSQSPPAEPICTIKEQPLSPVASAKCLGYWDLSANKSIDSAIGRARSSFFAFGAMGGFQGKLNPLSGRAIFETCVVPVLLFGSENWYLTEFLLEKLESFQAEIGRRILKLPRHHSGRATRLALEWPSMTACVLQRKLLFIQRASTNEESLGHLFLTHLMGDTPSEIPLQIVEGSRFLESRLGLDGLVKKTDVFYSRAEE